MDDQERAEEIFSFLLEHRMCATYRWVYTRIFGKFTGKWTQQHTFVVHQIARLTREDDIGEISGRLWALVVNGRTRIPHADYFRFSGISEKEWTDNFEDWGLVDVLTSGRKAPCRNQNP